MEKQRLQKVVAETGLYSRRAVEKLIDEKKVKVNGVLVTTKGLKVDPSQDVIQVQGKNIKPKLDQKTEVLLLHKPRRVIVSRSDPEERKTIYDLLPKKYHTFRNVGRLDYQSQGALLLTNDGDLINKLTHPKHHVEKVYHIKLSSHPDEKQLQRLARGVILDGVRTLPASMKLVEKSMTSAILEMVLTEGRNRQVRRMCEAVGLTVKELRRVSIGPVKLGKLRSGAYRLLTSREIKALKSA